MTMHERIAITRGSADRGLQREIDAIPAIDQHAHPLPLGMEEPGEPGKPIDPYDFPMPLLIRADNPRYLSAWAALWDREHAGWETADLSRLVKRKFAIIAEQGGRYNAWVLDQLNIEAMFAVGIEPEPTLPAPRFRWCAYVDWLLWPFPTEQKSSSASVAMALATMTRMRERNGCHEVPPTLDRYVDQVMMPMLRVCVERRAVCLKFNSPYYRSLHFADVPAAEAAGLYERGVRAGSLPAAEHRALQDHIFRRLVTEGGKLGLPVQMHTGYGLKEGFDIAGSNPLLFESVVHDIPGTKFQLLHSGWPFQREAISLMTYPNVYVDMSWACMLQPPRALAAVIRSALELFPEKLMYGTDTYSDRSIAKLSGVPVRANPLHGWEEKAWIMDRTCRDALGLALTAMMEDGEIDVGTASLRARQVMRDNALDLYAGAYP